MKLIDYVKAHQGAQAELAKSLGTPISSVNQWCHGVRPVPITRCVPIEQTTGGAVRRWDLRPDDWFRIWPELIGTEGAPELPADHATESR